jgi:hypothetical protein
MGEDLRNEQWELIALLLQKNKRRGWYPFKIPT